MFKILHFHINLELKSNSCWSNVRPLVIEWQSCAEIRFHLGSITAFYGDCGIRHRREQRTEITALRYLSKTIARHAAFLFLDFYKVSLTSSSQ